MIYQAGSKSTSSLQHIQPDKYNDNFNLFKKIQSYSQISISCFALCIYICANPWFADVELKISLSSRQFVFMAYRGGDWVLPHQAFIGFLHMPIDC